MSTATIPLSISPDAAVYVAELGMEQPFQQMLDHIQATVHGLRAIGVSLQQPYDLGHDPCVIFNVTISDQSEEKFAAEMDFGRWKHETFPTQVNQHFVLLSIHE